MADSHNPNQVKIFTLGEATLLLPRLSAMLRELQVKREKVVSLEVEIDALELISPKDDGGASPAVNQKVDEYTRLMCSFYGAIDEIHNLGCFLKDLNLGLIDFYSIQNKQPVFLCWKLGEEKIQYWHDLDKGFTARRKIE